jgi:hypothetical protein
MMRKTIPNKSQLALFDILFNRIIRLRLTNFLLGIGPPRNLNNHIENLRARSTIRGQQRNIMPGRNYHPILFKVNAMFLCVLRAYTQQPAYNHHHHNTTTNTRGAIGEERLGIMMIGDGTYKSRGDDASHRVQMSVKLGSPLTSYPCQTNISDENFDETAMRLMELKKFSMDLNER